MKQIETPFTLDGKHTYQGFLRSRSLEWFVNNNVLDNFKILKLVIDGSSKNEARTTKIPIGYKDYKIEEVLGRKLRLRMNINTNININKLYTKLKKFNSETLFIKELILQPFTEEYSRLIFRDKLTSDITLRKYVEKSKDTKGNPLFLQYIYDKKNLYKIRKLYFGKKMPISCAVLKNEKVVGYTIVKDGYEKGIE